MEKPGLLEHSLNAFRQNTLGRAQIVLLALFVVGGGYYGCRALNEKGLAEREQLATVLEKTRRDAERVQMPMRRREVAIPEAFVLKLELDGDTIVHAVEPDLYQSVDIGSEVSVHYRKRRLSGTIDVDEITKAY